MSLLYTASFKQFGSLVCLWHDVKLRKTQLEVRSLNVTWRRDLWCHRVIVFLEMCQIVGWTAMANLAAAVFFAICEKPVGGLISAPGCARVNPRPAGGGGQRAPPPCGFSQIAPKVLGISLWNLPYLSGQQFHTLCQKIRTQVIIGQPWVTSEWRHVSPILTNEMSLREWPPLVQF